MKKLLGRGFCIVTMVVLLISLTHAQANRSTDPNDFAKVEEQPVRGKVIKITAMNAEVDDRSVIVIIFDTDKMALPAPLVPPQPGAAPPPNRPLVQIRLEVYSAKGGTRSPVAPIPHYVDLISGTASPSGSQQASSDANKKETLSSGTIVYHDKYFNPEIGAGVIPNTEFNLRGTQAGDADFIEVRITNLETQQSLIRILIPQRFGFRTQVSDSFLLVKRLGINSTVRASGYDPSNFGPAAGVTYGGVFIGRSGVGRFLEPGIGVNVSFMNWSDPAIDKATGQTTPNTSTSSVQVGTGVILTFFSNVLQFTAGANLNANKYRFYWGIGFSFVNLAERLKPSK
jgi:hypothetical protein